MKKNLLLLITLCAFFTGCGQRHAINCITVDGQKVCFVREVWGLNGDRMVLTTTENVCHEPDKTKDYISNSLGTNPKLLYKIADGKLYIRAYQMIPPENPFPVKVIFERYDPLRRDEKLIEEGYSTTDLTYNKMTWCYRDYF